MATRRIHKEIQMLQQDPLDGIDVQIEDEDNLRRWIVTMLIPVPYANHEIRIQVDLGDLYPMVDPKFTFLPPIPPHPYLHPVHGVCTHCFWDCCVGTQWT